jgi:hypothetical protein
MKLGSRRTVTGIAAAAVLLAGSGAALAAGGPGLFGLGGGPEAQTSLLNAVATNLGVSYTKLRTAIKDALKAQVDQAVAAGKLTAAQGTAIKTRIDNGAVHVGVGGPRGLGGGDPLAAAATYLGMTQAAVRDALRGGSSLAALAQQKGKSVDGLEAAIVADATSALAAAVASGDLTDAQRDTILARVKSAVGDLVTRTGGERGPRGHGGMPGFGPGGVGPGFHARR